MRYVRVKIKRDTNTVHNRAVPEWEIPVLEFVFEDGNIEQTDAVEQNDIEYPEAAVEFDRLTRRYGSDPQTNVPYVASVYGNAGAGVRALAKVIAEVKAESETIVEAAPIPAKRGRRSTTADSLLS